MSNAVQYRSTRQAMSDFLRSTYQIGRLAYDAGPLILTGTILVRVLQSLIPATTAYLLKLLLAKGNFLINMLLLEMKRLVI